MKLIIKSNEAYLRGVESDFLELIELNDTAATHEKHRHLTIAFHAFKVSSFTEATTDDEFREYLENHPFGSLTTHQWYTKQTVDVSSMVSYQGKIKLNFFINGSNKPVTITYDGKWDINSEQFSKRKQPQKFIDYFNKFKTIDVSIEHVMSRRKQ